MPTNSIRINGDWEFIVSDSQMEGLLDYLRTISFEENNVPPSQSAPTSAGIEMETTGQNVP